MSLESIINEGSKEEINTLQRDLAAVEEFMINKLALDEGKRQELRYNKPKVIINDSSGLTNNYCTV